MGQSKSISPQPASGLKSGIFAILFQRGADLDTALRQLQGSRRYTSLMQFFSHIAYILKISIRHSIMIGSSTGWYVTLTLLGYHPGKKAASSRRGQLISADFRERLMITVTNVNQCELCSWAHSRAALIAGISEDEVNMLLVGDTANCPADERDALLFAQHWADTDGKPDDIALSKLIAHYGEEKAKAILVTLGVMRIGNFSGNAIQYNITQLKRKLTKSDNTMSNRQINTIKYTLWVFAPSAIIIGILVQFFPIAFWNLLGLGVAADAVLSRLYGAVLLGVGLMGAQALTDPVKHASLLLFIAYYKGVAALVLALAYFTHTGMPIATLIIALLYGGLAIFCFSIYPRNASQKGNTAASANTGQCG